MGFGPAAELLQIATQSLTFISRVPSSVLSRVHVDNALFVGQQELVQFAIHNFLTVSTILQVTLSESTTTPRRDGSFHAFHFDIPTRKVSIKEKSWAKLQRICEFLSKFLVSSSQNEITLSICHGNFPLINSWPT
jgi:hypothetical protein